MKKINTYYFSIILILFQYDTIVICDKSVSSTGTGNEFKVESGSVESYKACKRHCEKMKLLYECNCDNECEIYDDCCEMDLLDFCDTFHKDKIFFQNLISNTNSTENQEAALEESCCSVFPPKKCNCDRICESYNDCCFDYKDCLEKNKNKNKNESKSEDKIELPPNLLKLVVNTTKIEKIEDNI